MANLPLVVYRHAIEFPNPQAHSLQVASNVHALAAIGCDVHFSVRKWTRPTPAECFAFYGLPLLPKVQCLPRSRAFSGLRNWKGWLFRKWLAGRYASAPEVVFYLRDSGANFETINELVKLRGKLNLRIVLECHAVQADQLARRLAEAGTDEQRRALEAGRWGRARDLEIECVRAVDLLVAVSDGLKSELLALSGRTGPSVVLRNGADIPVRPAAAQPRSGILYLGHPYASKGLDDLIRAMALLPGENLTVVGGRDEADRALVAEWAAAAGVQDRVNVTGAVRHDLVHDYLAAARVAVLPLKKGTGSPLKAFEYMAAGTPIVATDAEANREIMQQSRAGVLVRSEDPAAIAEGIRTLLHDPELAESCGRNGRNWIADNSWQRRAERIIEQVGALA